MPPEEEEKTELLNGLTTCHVNDIPPQCWKRLTDQPAKENNSQLLKNGAISGGKKNIYKKRI